MKVMHKLIDTTLREGEQTPGIVFSIEQKFRMIELLSMVGVSEIELGTSNALVSCLPSLARFCRIHYPEMQLSLWSRCHENDIRHAASLQPDILSLSIPVSDIHIINRLAKNRSWAKSTLRSSIRHAQEAGMRVSVGFEDATRADRQFLKEMVLVAQNEGAQRIRLADTVGVGSPSSIMALFKDVHAMTDCELGIHAHNDFGMASANSITAFEAGALWADTTILGLGERTGCARLEELAGYLALVMDYRTIHAKHLKPLAKYVSEITGRTIAGNRPFIGDDIFTCETGLHLQGLQNDPNTYEPYDPEHVGAQRKLLFGAKSGRKAILQHMQKLGLSSLNQTMEWSHISSLRSKARHLGRPLSDEELLAHW